MPLNTSDTNPNTNTAISTDTAAIPVTAPSPKAPSISDAAAQALETRPIGRLLWEYSLPSIVAMTITSLYNIIASVFIGHGVGVMALSALAVAFPLMNLIMAFCFWVGTGGGALCSIAMGKQDQKGVDLVLGHVVMLSTGIAVLFGAASLFFLDDMLAAFGASEATLPYGHDYMQVLLLTLPIGFNMLGLNTIMRSTGYPKKAMYSAMLSVAVNVIVAPVLIFVLKWDMVGAGLGTVAGHFASMVWIFRHFNNKNNKVHFKASCFRWNTKIATRILSVGMPVFLMNLCACGIVILINQSLKAYGGDVAIGAYGILNRVLMLIAMIIMGVAQGMQPIVGYNYGAQLTRRVLTALRYGLYTSFAIGICGLIVVETGAEWLARMFTSDVGLIELSAQGLRLSSICMPLMGCQIIITSFYQSINRPKVSAFLSLSRQLIFLVPGLLILPGILGVSGVWCSIPIADAMATLTALLFIIPTYKHFKKCEGVECV